MTDHQQTEPGDDVHDDLPTREPNRLGEGPATLAGSAAGRGDAQEAAAAPDAEPDEPAPDDPEPEGVGVLAGVVDAGVEAVDELLLSDDESLVELLSDVEPFDDELLLELFPRLSVL